LGVRNRWYGWCFARKLPRLESGPAINTFRLQAYDLAIPARSGHPSSDPTDRNYGGTAILSLLVDDPRYQQNSLRQDLWRAGHAHAGVLLILSLVALRYVDEANLSEGLKKVVRSIIPSSAILLPAAFFLSVLSPDATRPNQLIYLAHVGAVVLSIGLVLLGVGLLRKPPAGSAKW
jgi:hypothetical protein